jgi:hypothetical protein
MVSTKERNTGGIGFFGLLAIVFITLKLTNYIDWSWWLVLAPLWGPLVVIVSILFTFLVFVKSVKYRK